MSSHEFEDYPLALQVDFLERLQACKFKHPLQFGDHVIWSPDGKATIVGVYIGAVPEEDSAYIYIKQNDIVDQRFVDLTDILWLPRLGQIVKMTRIEERNFWTYKHPLHAFLEDLTAELI